MILSTKCLPKKAGKRWETWLSRFSIFWVSTRCLPRALFLWKSALFYLLLAGFPHLFCCARGVIHPLGRLLGENSPVLNEKSAKIQAFSPNNDRCKIMALYSKQVGGRPLNVAMERSTGPLLTVGTGRGSSPACFGFRGEKRSVEIWSERLHRSEGQKN